jgi:hypothetical protein
MSNVQAKVTVEDVLKNPKFPPDWPYSANDFKRMDESEDEVSCVCVCVCVCVFVNVSRAHVATRHACVRHAEFAQQISQN